MSDDDAVALVRRCFEAYALKDRARIEAVIGDPFAFTSPLDHAIDRATYFARCWPNSAAVARFDLRHVVAHDDTVFVTYEAHQRDGRVFRNTERFTCRDGRIVAVEVYFGWAVPHPAPSGGFIGEPTA